MGGGGGARPAGLWRGARTTATGCGGSGRVGAGVEQPMPLIAALASSRASKSCSLASSSCDWRDADSASACCSTLRCTARRSRSCASASSAARISSASWPRRSLRQEMWAKYCCAGVRGKTAGVGLGGAEASDVGALAPGDGGAGTEDGAGAGAGAGAGGGGGGGSAAFEELERGRCAFGGGTGASDIQSSALLRYHAAPGAGIEAATDRCDCTVE